MRRAVCWALVAGCLLTAAAQADDWPSHLIKATIPFGAGSAADVVPRAVFDRLAAELGQAIIVENRPGAGGTIGSAAVAKADPDGYNILAQSSALTISPAIYPKLPFDITKDLSSVLMLGVSANVMIVPVSRPWKTVQDFIADAKSRKPGSISFGSAGVGSATHISAEKFRLAVGIETTHVPYRGGAEAVADILGGRIDFYFCPLTTALPLIREGRVRALVISTGKRVTDLPDVPTPAEAGLKNAESVFWLGVFMPAKTPREIIERFYHAGTKVLAEPSMRESLTKLGIEPFPMKPAEMDAFVAREIADNAKTVRAAGIKP
ncbi:tripartite tricarboxylate transporter substrate binding protein [Bradyrhizobium sp.]|uniref:Bug family tripartite tricarboxylate transporter substrate binding protein n=1 Tax=Bradyrhizobium sp. TaxID=376 RepID=UPI0026356C13|nr:tripartite tricarboxylate transporter substrate binding protein [Bradyrhizobium sp.]